MALVHSPIKRTDGQSDDGRRRLSNFAHCGIIGSVPLKHTKFFDFLNGKFAQVTQIISSTSTPEGVRKYCKESGGFCLATILFCDESMEEIQQLLCDIDSIDS